MNENYKSIDKQTVEKYLDYYLDEAYKIEREKTKVLEEEIIKACNTLEIPNEVEECDLCIVKEWNQLGQKSLVHIGRYISEIKDSKDFVTYFSKQILDEESKVYSNFEFFQMKQDIANIKRTIEFGILRYR